VRDPEAIPRQLREEQIAVVVDPEAYPGGGFGRVIAPEGNPIELWEPADPERRKGEAQSL
jgi:hypothetical protein